MINPNSNVHIHMAITLACSLCDSWGIVEIYENTPKGKKSIYYCPTHAEPILAELEAEQRSGVPRRPSYRGGSGEGGVVMITNDQGITRPYEKPTYMFKHDRQGQLVEYGTKENAV